ncbi:MAG: hypothetical protein D6707_03580 [Bacteroidetes bacterium]|nr:MAG: hypothetical protein D6707_03580 [Bacteroidota bacterium]
MEYLRTLTLTGDYFDTDAMNHIYLVQGDKLIKFNFDGQQQFVYSNKGFGKIFSVDATNPLKILVFFQESGACVFLDNTLTENSEPFYLYDYCCDLPLLSAASQLNGIWVYENINFELMRYDTNWKELATTGNLYQLLKKEITPKKIIERNGKVYLLTENSIEIFDVFGTYLKTLPVNNVSDFDIEGESMVYIQKDKVVLLNLKTLDETVLNNTGQYQSLSLSEKKLFLSQRKGIDIFQIKYE